MGMCRVMDHTQRMGASPHGTEEQHQRGQALAEFAIVLPVLFALIGYYISPWLLEVLGAQPDVVALGAGYLRITFVGVIVMFYAGGGDSDGSEQRKQEGGHRSHVGVTSRRGPVGPLTALEAL